MYLLDRYAYLSGREHFDSQHPAGNLLGGSWVVISRVTIHITHIRGLITLLIFTHEPPSTMFKLRTCSWSTP